MNLKKESRNKGKQKGRKNTIIKKCKNVEKYKIR